MISIKEQYFPLLRQFPHRLNRWQYLNPKRMPGYRLISGHPISVAEYVLPEIPGIPGGKCIAFVTDLHYHRSRKSLRILHHLEKLLSSYSPDYLLLGGDMVGDATDIPALEEILPQLRKRADVCLAAGGNWEYGKVWLGRNFWKEFYARQDIRFLENEIWADGNIVFSAVADVSSGICKLPEMNMNKLNIMMAHSPDTAVALDRRKRQYFPQIILCGHTHGGQVNLPIINVPLRIHSHYGNFFAHGVFHHKIWKTTMFVCAGLNELSFPWRFNCRRELLIIKTSGKAQ